MFIDDCKDKKYKETFNAIYKSLCEQKENDPSYKIEHLEKFLECLYFNEGNNWVGRGDEKDVSDSATIAACELLLCEWREEIKKEV